MGNTQSEPANRPVIRDEVDEQRLSELNIDFNCDEFTFDSLVLEGGGAKGAAYCGSIEVLEETGIWPRIRRLAGTSAGAMAAALLSVGYGSEELKAVLDEDLSNLFLDHSWGYASLLPNLIYYFGWNPEIRYYDWLGKKFEEKTGNADITFMEVYEKYGRELCIVATNVNQMRAEFCHPKTTPDMPVRVAVRMSTALPVYFQPVFHDRYGKQEVFIDGAIVCNYPIKCFDGWWLSMKKEDSFLCRLPHLSLINQVYDDDDRFGTFNPNTIGILLYTGNEHEVFKKRLEARPGIVHKEGLPDTPLASQYKMSLANHDSLANEHSTLASGTKKLVQILDEHKVDFNHVISAKEIQAVMGNLTKEERGALFGESKDPVSVMDSFRALLGEEPKFSSLVKHFEKMGLEMQTRYQVLNGKPKINRFSEFLSATSNALLFNAQRQSVREDDFVRTVGINTHHVGTIDFAMDDRDKKYLVQQGRRAMKAFLHMRRLMH